MVSEIASIRSVPTTPGERTLASGLVTRFSRPADFDLNGVPVTTDESTQFVDGVVGDLEANVEITLNGEITSGGDTVLVNEIYFDGLASDSTTLMFDFDNFTNLSVTGFLNLIVTQGLSFSVEVMVNSDLVDNVQVTQSGNTVSFEQAVGSNNTLIRDVFVTMPVLNRIDVGAGSLANVTLRDFDQTQMTVNVDGVSLLRGEALSIDDLTATVSGVSQAILNMRAGTT